ncbi:MAG: GntR family transcriptional regulator [Christensenellales bacterium]
MLDRNNPKPLYAQLEDLLRTSIMNGEWKVNHAIPSENELSKRYGLSRMTVRSVITMLVKEGLLYRVQGKGTFVSEPKIVTRSPAYMGVREQLEQMGYEIRTRLVHFEIIPANNNIAMALGIAPGDLVTFIERIRYTGGQPISLHRSYIPVSLCPGLEEADLEGEQLCVIVERQFGYKAASVFESLESVPANAEEADLLQIDRGYPILMLEDVNKTAEGTIFEYTKVLFRGDKVKLHFEYEA